MIPCPFLFRSGLSAATLAVALAAQSPSPTAERPAREPAASVLAGGLGLPAGQVLFDTADDGRLWALASTYKASFGPDGFVFVPFFGSQAPCDHPVHLVLDAVRVGEVALPLASPPVIRRDGSRVDFDRGPVHEIYDLTSDSVEQIFVIDGDRPGDVEVIVRVVSDLVDDPSLPGMQLGNELGGVDYGAAHLVVDGTKSPIATTYDEGVLRLHVPAALRGEGPVVIDPLLGSHTLPGTLMASDSADLAYDATTDRWALVWVHTFSATDHDVLCEVRTAAGDPVIGGAQILEATTEDFFSPRIGNLASADRFLVAMERYDPQQRVGQQYTVWGRTLDATTPFRVGARLPISPPASQDPRVPDVGGDPGSGSLWAVVWTAGGDIQGRTVGADGTLGSTIIPVEASNDFCMGPQISNSNGNGLTAAPLWCVVYMRRVDAANWDIYASTLGTDGGVLESHSAIASGLDNDLYAFVSSPMTDARAVPAFLVSWERQQSTGPEMIVRLVDADLDPLTPEVDLTRRYGYSGIFCRVESDGVRFAATCVVGNTLQVGTLALAGGDLVLHEALVPVGSALSPMITAKRSGGGVNSDYGIAFTNKSYTPTRITLAAYQGRAPSGGFLRRWTGCGSAFVDATGEPYLGRRVTFTLKGSTSAAAGLLLGFPAPGITLCDECQLGLDPSRPIVPLPSPATVAIPTGGWAVGVTFAVQGYAQESGLCLPVSLTETWDTTIE